MFFTPQIRGPRFPFLSKGVRRTRCRPARDRRCRRMHVEPLEDRSLLSAGAVDPTFDLGGLLENNGGTNHSPGLSVVQDDRG